MALIHGGRWPSRHARGESEHERHGRERISRSHGEGRCEWRRGDANVLRRESDLGGIQDQHQQDRFQSKRGPRNGIIRSVYQRIIREFSDFRPIQLAHVSMRWLWMDLDLMETK